MWRLVLGVFAALMLSGLGSPPPRESLSIGVHVRTDNGGPVGVPIEVLVRGEDGKVAVAGRTDDKGDVMLKVEWETGHPPAQIEARMSVSERRMVGTVTTFASVTNQYCLAVQPFQAEECGVPGTGTIK